MLELLLDLGSFTLVTTGSHLFLLFIISLLFRFELQFYYFCSGDHSKFLLNFLFLLSLDSSMAEEVLLDNGNIHVFIDFDFDLLLFTLSGLVALNMLSIEAYPES